MDMDAFHMMCPDPGSISPALGTYNTSPLTIDFHKPNCSRVRLVSCKTYKANSPFFGVMSSILDVESKVVLVCET